MLACVFAGDGLPKEENPPPAAGAGAPKSPVEDGAGVDPKKPVLLLGAGAGDPKAPAAGAGLLLPKEKPPPPVGAGDAPKEKAPVEGAGDGAPKLNAMVIFVMLLLREAPVVVVHVHLILYSTYSVTRVT